MHVLEEFQLDVYTHTITIDSDKIFQTVLKYAKYPANLSTILHLKFALKFMTPVTFCLRLCRFYDGFAWSKLKYLQNNKLIDLLG